MRFSHCGGGLVALAIAALAAGCQRQPPSAVGCNLLLLTLDTVACVGGCSIAPVVTANGRFYGRLDKKKLEELIVRFREAGEVVE